MQAQNLLSYPDDPPVDVAKLLDQLPALGVQRAVAFSKLKDKEFENLLDEYLNRSPKPYSLESFLVVISDTTYEYKKYLIKRLDKQTLTQYFTYLDSQRTKIDWNDWSAPLNHAYNSNFLCKYVRYALEVADDAKSTELLQLLLEANPQILRNFLESFFKDKEEEQKKTNAPELMEARSLERYLHWQIETSLVLKT